MRSLICKCISILVAMTCVTGVPSSFAADQPTSPPKPPTTASSPAPQATPDMPSPATVLNKSKVQGVLGKDVRSNTGEDMGRIVDVIVDHSGGPRAAIIDFGGFLGVGSRKIAVDWNALHFTPSDGTSQVTLDLSRDQVKAAPEYIDNKPIVVLGASGNTQPMPPDQ
jgi:PRC-barrel domain protein